MKIIFKNILYCVLLITTTASSKSNYWEHTNGPYSSYGNSISVDTHGNVFLGARDGLYLSTNKGDDWTSIQNTPFNEIDFVLCSRDSLIYIVGSSHYVTDVYFTTNSGHTWSPTGLNSDYAHCFTLTNSGTLLVGTQSVYQSGGLFRLPKRSTHWSLVLPSDIVRCVGSKGNVIFAGTSEGFFRSFDDGINWSKIEDSAFNIVSAIGINRKGDILASNWTGTYLSEDNGDHWNKLTDVGGSTLSLDSIGNIYLGGGNHMNISRDDGKTWIISDSGLPKIEIKGIACDQSNNIYAVCYKEGVFRSTDHGSSWQRVNSGLTDLSISSILITAEDAIYVGSSSGIFCSSNQGNQWNQLLPANYYSSYSLLAINTNGYLFTGGYDIGIYSSSDLGKTWQKASYYSASAMVADQNNNIYAGTSKYGIIVSQDNGNSWRHLGLDSIWIESATITPNGTIFWGTNENGIYSQSPNGTIKQVCNIQEVISLACNSTGVLFAGTYGRGIFRSTDQGKTWINMDNNSPALYIFSLLVDKADNIYASTYNYGVIYSSNDGANWDQLISGLDAIECYSLAISPKGRLYVGTNRGLFRSVKEISLPDKPLPRYSTPFLSQNYPNPFNSLSKIDFYLPEQSEVRITVYDLLGREIKVLTNSLFIAGWHSVLCNSEGLNSGIYIYRMQTDNYSSTKKFVLLK